MNKSLQFFLLVFFSINALAQDRNIIPLKVTGISIFKNGTCFVSQTGNVSSKDKIFYFAPPEKVLNGTFWYALKDANISTINIKNYTTSVTKKAVDISDYLQANINKEVTLTLLYGNVVSTIKGTVLDFSQASRNVKIKTADNTIKILTMSNIIGLDLSEAAASSYKEDSVMNLAKVTLNKDIQKSEFNVLSIQPNFSWVPSYQLRLTDAKKAALNIKATISNASQPIVDVPVSLVVGNPQMFYGQQLDMISNESYVSYDYKAKGYANANTVSSYDYAVRAAEPETNENTEGEKSNDLYYYNLGNLTLEKDAKTLVKLGSYDVEYKDLYELNIEDKVNYWQTRIATIDPNTIYETWHVLKIENKTGAPFSNGPIFVIDEKGKPLAQDELNYTPMGATSKIKLSKAIDVQTCDDEEVISTDNNNKVKNNKREYEKVKIKGKIKIINYQPKAISINISKTVNGNITNSYGGTTTKLPNRNSNYYNLNDIGIIKWDKEIKPNETLVLEYEYEVLVLIN